MLGLGTSEIMVIALVFLLLFGGKELPSMIRKVTSIWRDIQRTTDDVKKEINTIIYEEEDDDNNLSG